MKNLTPRLLTVTAGAAVAAAAVLIVPSSASAATVTSVRSWSAGTLSVGQSKSYVWNNANSDAYQVNTAGTRAGNPASPCQLTVTSQSYSRTAGGARQFHLTIKNTDAVACDAAVYLATITADRSGATGTLNPGQSKTWYWRNSNLRSLVYLAGATPGIPATGTCQLDVRWKSRVTASDEQQFGWTVRNIGSVACDGQWRLGWLPVDETTTFPDDDPPTPSGIDVSLSSPISSPYRVYLFGLIPIGAGTGNCDWAPTHLAQSGDPAIPTPDSRTDVGYTNSGSVPCVIHQVTKAYIQ